MRFRDNGPYAVFDLNLYLENAAKIVDNSEFARQNPLQLVSTQV
jgi:hypothetical protein